MKSLKELVNMQTLTGESDFEIIYDWFIENDKELEGITLMEKLARGKAEKLGNELGRIKGTYLCIMEHIIYTKNLDQR